MDEYVFVLRGSYFFIAFVITGQLSVFSLIFGVNFVCVDVKFEIFLFNSKVLLKVDGNFGIRIVEYVKG